jgi:hypothetical protein
MTTNETKKHPWRVCPLGSHLVKAHIVKIPPSKKHPNGIIITRQQHCAKNPSKKDLLSFPEVQLITANTFPQLSNNRKLGTLSDFKEKGDKYDLLISGWVQYWNEVLAPNDPLDPKLVKALIATESSFNSDSKVFAGKKQGYAKGLMQITDETLGILNNPKGELKDNIFRIKSDERYNPSANICAGVRWLFWKKRLASVRLKRETSWIEGIAEYKSYLSDMLSGKNPNPKGMQNLNKYYHELKIIEFSKV